MLHTEDDDFIIRLIGQIIDEIGATPRHHMAHAFGRLGSAEMRKEQQELQAIVDRVPHRRGSVGMLGADEVGDRSGFWSRAA
jgi:hypothetical protein